MSWYEYFHALSVINQRLARLLGRSHFPTHTHIILKILLLDFANFVCKNNIRSLNMQQLQVLQI